MYHSTPPISRRLDHRLQVLVNQVSTRRYPNLSDSAAMYISERAIMHLASLSVDAVRKNKYQYEVSLESTEWRLHDSG